MGAVWMTYVIRRLEVEECVTVKGAGKGMKEEVIRAKTEV